MKLEGIRISIFQRYSSSQHSIVLMKHDETMWTPLPKKLKFDTKIIPPKKEHVFLSQTVYKQNPSRLETIEGPSTAILAAIPSP